VDYEDAQEAINSLVMMVGTVIALSSYWKLSFLDIFQNMLHASYAVKFCDIWLSI
jgi:hypothetical protein